MSKRPTRRPAAPPPRKKPWWPWALLGGLVVIALVIAVVSTRGSDDEVTEGSVGTDNVSTPAETQPVTVVGDSLPTQPQSGLDATANGLAAPTLQGFRFDGTAINITPGERPKMVVFLAHWCPHCNNEIPVLLSWRDAGGIPADLDVVGVSTAASASAPNYPPSEWITNKQWAWPVLVDNSTGNASIAYGVGGYPTIVIVGADGKVKMRYSGELPQADLDVMVDQALAG